MPRTRWSPSIEPKGPKLSRFATIREARTGPIQGSRSISSALARSISTGPASSDAGSGAGGGASAGEPERRRAAARVRVVVRDRARSTPADSTRAICAARAARVSLLAVGDSRARTRRTAPPSAISAARNSSALRSELVTQYDYDAAALIWQRYLAIRIERTTRLRYRADGIQVMSVQSASRQSQCQRTNWTTDDSRLITQYLDPVSVVLVGSQLSVRLQRLRPSAGTRRRSCRWCRWVCGGADTRCRSHR